jgi:hypothetical protein
LSTDVSEVRTASIIRDEKEKSGPQKEEMEKSDLRSRKGESSMHEAEEEGILIQEKLNFVSEK